MKKMAFSFRAGKAGNNLLLSGVGAVLNYFSFVLIAYFFGASSETDLFIFGFSFLLVLAALVTTVFSGIFLPLYIRLLHGTDVAAAIGFCNAFFVRVLCLCMVIFLVLSFSTTSVFGLVSKFSPEKLDESHGWLWGFGPLFMLMVINEFFRTLLQAREGYATASGSVVVQAAGTLLFLWPMAYLIGAPAMILAAVASRVAQFFFLWAQLKRYGVSVSLRWISSPHIGDFTKLAAPYWVASIVSMASVFYYDYLASGLPVGQLTAVSFAQKIYILPLSMLAMPLIEILNTRLAILYAKGDFCAVEKSYLQAVTWALLGMLPIALSISLNAENISAILFSRGAYSEQSLLITSSALSVYALALPCLVVFAINGRVSLTFRKTKIPSAFGSIGHLLSMLTVWFLVTSFGYMGLAWGKFYTESLYFLPFGFVVVKFCLPIPWNVLSKNFLRIGFAAAISYAVVAVLVHWLAHSNVQHLVMTIGSSLLLFAIFLSLCRLFGVMFYDFLENLTGAVKSPV